MYIHTFQNVKETLVQIIHLVITFQPSFVFQLCMEDGRPQTTYSIVICSFCHTGIAPFIPGIQQNTLSGTPTTSLRQAPLSGDTSTYCFMFFISPWGGGRSD